MDIKNNKYNIGFASLSILVFGFVFWIFSPNIFWSVVAGATELIKFFCFFGVFLILIYIATIFSVSVEAVALKNHYIFSKVVKFMVALAVTGLMAIFIHYVYFPVFFFNFKEAWAFQAYPGFVVNNLLTEVFSVMSVVVALLHLNYRKIL